LVSALHNVDDVVLVNAPLDVLLLTRESLLDEDCDRPQLLSNSQQGLGLGGELDLGVVDGSLGEFALLGGGEKTEGVA